MDNIAPSLYGGLVLTVGHRPSAREADPGAAGVRAVVVHPHMFLATAKARAILKGNVDLSDFVWQTANLAGFISGCYTDDLDMIRASFEDVVIEPQRQALIPGFLDVRRGAMAAGALGCSISGAGPSMFAWSLEPTRRGGARRPCGARFGASRSSCDTWIIDVNSPRRAGDRVSAAPADAVRQLARTAAHASASAQRCCRDWRPMADCTCRQLAAAAGRRRSTARRTCRQSRARAAARRLPQVMRSRRS